MLTAGITAYYMFRMVFITFFGAYRGNVDPSELGLRHPEFAGTAAPPRIQGKKRRTTRTMRPRG